MEVRNGVRMAGIGVLVLEVEDVLEMFLWETVVRKDFFCGWWVMGPCFLPASNFRIFVVEGRRSLFLCSGLGGDEWVVVVKVGGGRRY